MLLCGPVSHSKQWPVHRGTKYRVNKAHVDLRGISLLSSLPRKDDVRCHFRHV